MAQRSPEEIAREYKLIADYKKSGDLQLLGELYRPYMHLVYGLCLKYLKDRTDSQDAVMQIFEKLIDTVKEHEINNFKSWLYVLSKNHCLMWLRSKKHKISQESKDISTVNMESELVLHHDNEAIDEENLSKLEECLETLQLEQKTCVKLFYLEKRSYKEVVQLTTYELKKVKSHIQNGKRNLKNCMEKGSE